MTERALDINPVDTYQLTGYKRLHKPNDLDGSQVPGWTPEEVPKRLLTPYVPSHGFETVDTKLAPYVGPGIAVCPDSDEAILWYTPTRVVLTDFSLTVRREVRPDGSVATSGASAVLSVSVYVQQNGGHYLRDRATWVEKATKVPLARAAAYSVLPAAQHGLAVQLDLPAGVASADPIISVSPLGGAATIAVELTESAALTWRTALEQGEGSTIPGTVRATVSIPTSNTDPDNWYPGVDTYKLDAALSTLLASRGPADIQQIDPQQTVKGTVLVIGSQLVGRSTVTMRPSGDQAPVSDEFRAAGGRLDISMVTQHPDTASVDWKAEVSFTPPKWPTIPMSGRLDAQTGWITMLKPESWCVGYLLAVVPVNAAGKPVAAHTRSRDRVQGVLNFTAPYVGGGLLTSAFEADYGRPTNLALPRYPQEEFGDLVLSVFVTVGGILGQASRKLGEAEVVVTALAYPDAKVELHTTTDSLPEAASGVAALLSRLTVLAAG